MDEKGFVIVYTYSIDGNLLKAQMSPPSDPQRLNQLKQREVALLKLIVQATDNAKKSSLLQDLAFFYIHDVGVPDKAQALLPLITNRQQSFNVHLHLIDGDITLSDQEKGRKLKDLEEQYPEQKQLLDVLSAARLAGR